MSDLHAQRVMAAEVTHGTSGDPIYQATLAWYSQLGLRGDLLEFGAGSGELLRRILALGLASRLTGADIMARPAGLPVAVEWLQADLNYPLPTGDQSFDVVLSTEVIEHLENPRAVFREFFRMLRPGGTLLVTTPNQESLRAYAGLLLGGHFVAFLGASYPAHITAILRKDFERICLETGFTGPEFRYTDSGGLPKLPQVLWQNLSFGLLRGRLFSDNILLVARKP